MPKFKIICFLLAAVMASVGTALLIRNLGGDFVPPNNENAETDLNVYLDRTEDMDISDPNADARTFLFVAHKILLQRPSFKGVSAGTSTAMGGIEQNVLNTRVVLGDFGNKRVFKEMVTKGIVSNAYQLYLDGIGDNGNYVYRGFNRVVELENVEWSDTALPLSKQAFYNKFGHRSDKLTSYILNWDTVQSGTLVEEKDGLFTFRYVLDTETAPALLRYEMVTNGGLSGFPTFTKCEIYVTMDADFNVKSLRTDCEYQAMTMGINAGCTEDITETFLDYDGDLPYSEFFTPYLGQIGGSFEAQETPLEMLMQMFQPYLNGTDLNVRLSVANNGEQLADALLSVCGLDISDLSKMSVNAQVGKLNVGYNNGDGKLLLNYEDFNASTTVDGLTQIAGTFSSLLGTDVPQAASEDSEQSGFDAGAILNKLTYTISDDKNTCTVSIQLTSDDLPVDLGDLTVDAKLVGYLEGESYNFAYADIALGDISIHIAPEEWTPVVIDGNAPEILGLADLLGNGKLSLNADVRLPLFGTEYDVNADLLADFGNKSVKAEATLNHNGKAELCFVDNVAYAAFGEQLRFKLDVSDVDGLAQLFGDLFGETLSSSNLIATSDFDTAKLLALFGGFEAVNTGSGKVALVLTVGEMKLSLNLAAVDSRWNIETINAQGYGVNATIAPKTNFEDITAPADADSYADVTKLVDTFAQPIADLVRGKGYGIELTDMRVTLDGKQYDVKGSIALDESGKVKVDVTVYDGNVGIVDAVVTVADGNVYLTLNGVSVAFAADGLSNGDADVAAALQQLADNEQIKQLLDSHDDVKQLIDSILGAAQTVKDFDLHDLLTMDLTQFVTGFGFENGKLSVALNGETVGLDIIANVALSVENGRLCVEADGKIANLELDVLAKAQADVTVETPDANDYLLTLHGEFMGAEADITADLVHMDIWASVQFRNETVLLRYKTGNVYVVYGGAKLVFDVTDLDGLLDKVQQLMGDKQLPDMPQADVLALFAALGYNLTGEQPNLSFRYNDVSATVNFANSNGKLVFDNVNVEFALDGKQYSATLTTSTHPAAKLDTNDTFADGNALINKVLDTVSELLDTDNFAFAADLQVAVGGNNYAAHAEINLNNGLYVKLTVRDSADKVIISAEITVVDNVLYLDVNGIRQATELGASNATTGNGFDFKQLLGILKELKGENDVLDSVIDAIEQLPSDLGDVTFSDVIDNLYLESDKLIFELALGQFGLGDAELSVGLGKEPTLTIEGFAFGAFALNGTVAVKESTETVKVPDKTRYTTGLRVDLGNGVTALLRLSLLDKKVSGTIALPDSDDILFLYEEGIFYLQYGEVNAKLAVKDATELLGALGKLVTLPVLPDVGNADLTETVKKVFGMIGYNRMATEDGYSIELAVKGMNVTIHFVCTDDTATLDFVNVATGTDLVPYVNVKADDAVSFAELDMNREFMDVTQVVENFAEPLSALLHAEGYGVTFDTDVTLDGTKYNVSGTLAIDANKAVKVNATVKQGEVGIINVETTVADGAVFLTVNGIKVAFKLNDRGDETDFSQTFDKLLQNEQIKSLLEEHQGLQALIDKIKEVADAFANTDVEDIDFGTLLQHVSYENNTLSLTVNASAFALGTFTVEVGNDNGNLAVTLKDFVLENITVDSLRAAVGKNTDVIETPNPADYVLNLHFEGFGAVADISADLYNMDIAANVTYSNSLNGIKINETAQLRFVNNKLYVKLNKIALVFDADSAKELVTRLTDMPGIGNTQMHDMDINDMLGKLAIDLAGKHTVSYTDDNFTLSVNFKQVGDNTLGFDGVTAMVGGQMLTLNMQTALFDKLPIDGNYVNGNKLIDKICDIAEAIDLKALINGEGGIEAEFTVGLTLDENIYNAQIKLVYNSGLYVDVTLKDGNGNRLVTGNITLKDNVLLLDVNGIKQAVKLSGTQNDSSAEKFKLDDLENALESYKGINDVLDAVIYFVQGLPGKLHDLETVSDLVDSLTLDDHDNVVLVIAATKLGLASDVTINLGSDNGKVTFAVGNIELGSASKPALVAAINNGSAIAHGTAVNAPSAEEIATYVAEFTLGVTIDKQNAVQAVYANDVAASSDIMVTLRLDLYNNRIYGYANIGNNKVVFELDTASGNVFVEMGKEGDYLLSTKLRFNVKTELDEVVAAVKDVLASLDGVDITLPELGGGNTADTVKSILDNLTYISNDNGYMLGVNFNGIDVNVGFNVENDSVSLGDLTVSGEGFAVSANQNAVLDATNVGLSDARDNVGNYLGAKDVISELAPAIKALIEAEGYNFDLSGKLTLGDNTYKLSATVKLINGNIDVKFSLENVISGEVWVVDGFLYVKIGGFSIKLALPENSAEGTFTTDDLDSVLDTIAGFDNDYLNQVVELIRKLLSTDVSNLSISDMLGITRTKDGLQLTVDGSAWGISQFTATVSPETYGGNTVGVKLTLSDFGFGDIKLSLDKASVTATTVDISLPANDNWTTDLDIIVEDGTDTQNTIHVSLDLVNKVVYAKIESKNESDDITYELYIKYNMASNELWISNHSQVNVFVDISDIGNIVNEVQNVVNKVAREEHNFELPGLFQGGISLDDILSTLKLSHDAASGGFKLSLNAMGFGIAAVVGNNAITADIDVSSLFDGTVLHMQEGLVDIHVDFAKEMDSRIDGKEVNYVSVDEVFDYLFYGTNGTLDDDKENNGVMYDLIETNAWRFDFDGDTDISIDSKDDSGNTTTDSYRIAKGSYFVFAFNKTDTDFSLNQMIQTFNTDKSKGYKLLFELLNSLQLRAHLTIQKKPNGQSEYSEMMYLDVALIRYQEPVQSESGLDTKPKSRLYISYDTSESHSGVLRATLSLDALKDVISLKDALDSVLNGAITNLVNTVTGAIAEAQNSMPKLQLGRLARLFSSVTYGGKGQNFGLTLNGKALSDKLGNIGLNVSAYEPTEGETIKRGRGLTLNSLELAFDGIQVKLNNMIVSASTYTATDGESNAANRSYDYVTNFINGYLDEHKASDSPSGDLSTAENFNKSNVAPLGSETGYDMSNYINLDSIYQLAASLVITAGNEDESGRRSFLIKGDANVDIIVGAEALANAHLVLNITMYADIDENGDSYFAVKIHRDNVKLQVLGLGHNLYKDRGGDSYITFDTKSGNFNVYRDSYRDDIEVSEQQEEWYWWCPKCKAERPTKLCVLAWHNDSMQHLTRTVTKQVTKTGYESVLLGEPGFKDENISPAEFMANLLGSDDANARCSRGYLFEILNLGKPLSINIENIIKDQINNPDAKVFGVDYGVEDILDTGDAYNYGDATDNNGNAVANHKQFEIKANLSPVSSALGTLDIKIHHSGSFENLMKWNEATGKYEYDTEKLAAIKLDRLCGGLKIANNIVTITFDLGHTTPGYGTAKYFTDDLTQLWTDSNAWTNAHLL